MGTLYRMVYGGQIGAGGGALYLGDGKLLGVDVSGGRYEGTYTENGGRIRLDITLTMDVDGVLVTGQQAPAGTTLQMQADWPANFADGSAQPITVGGHPVQVILTKIGDIP